LVSVAVGVSVCVAVGAAVSVEVGVTDAVLVGVNVGPNWTTNRGAATPSLEKNLE
jgi:hypothetical protein